ncbi:translation initiation factor IF-3 [Desulfomicrobium sp. ZS1]|uniref:Translation initiation factor IF-3 n=1 Tax=Desulfomicrobium baculatum (strain DSM 4028 / VKM B-1378 / X) TaxID=525897 RepID=C7LV67_DESBD|nr:MULTISPECIES: translation initiation factor IF-3 [Desulfomicrobium]ACU91071.1 translation initiation factor IF-3 [Desulfomicrobium baculatum DSM 4028]UTF51954.1 translation initiation factor IF-3 [Desulfomicrobium sp. ZS1]
MLSAAKARRNKQIRAKEIRVVGDDGNQLGIMTVPEALEQAEAKGLDLVEVAPNAKPPVCKIMDYGKYLYEEKKKSQEAKKRQTQIQVKEIKFRPHTDDHDLMTKIKHIRRFIEDGDRCKVTVFFRGREMAHKDRGQVILDRIVEMVSDVAKVEQTSRVEGRTMFLLLAGLPKK